MNVYDNVVTEGIGKQIANQLRQAILDGRLRANERLPTEAELAERFAVSRPTIREALKHLAAQNLIRSRRGASGGTFVKEPSDAEAQQSLTSAMTLLVSMGKFSSQEIDEARLELERLCCRLAIKRVQKEQLDAMAAEVELQRSDIDDQDFCASDVRFHRALVDATGNAVLQYLMCAVIEALQPLSNMIVFRFRERDRIVAQHQRILEAMKSSDEAAALDALDDQLSYLREQYVKAQEWRAEHRKIDKKE